MQKEKCNEIMDILAETYPYAQTQLDFRSAYELLVAVILSAQCTDKRVNIVTDKLFKNYNTPQTMLTLTQEGLEEIIKPCGLFRSKAKHILSASASIIRDFHGEVPSTIEQLKKLEGVGQKTANVVYSVAFDGDALAVDTHVFRLANRIGLAKSTTPSGVEKQLCEVIDKSKWSRSHHYLIFHGRNICKAVNPDCGRCPIEKLCEKNGLKSKLTKKKV